MFVLPLGRFVSYLSLALLRVRPWLSDNDAQQHEAARLDALSKKLQKQLQTRRNEHTA
jgi:hypothetical protein